MSESMKPTPGPWEADGGAVSSGAVSCIADCTFARVMPGWSGTDYATGVHMRDNARLIAEAGTVFHETQLSPRQLVEQRDELLVTLDHMHRSLLRQLDLIQERAPGGYLDKQPLINSLRMHAQRAQKAIAKCEVKP